MKRTIPLLITALSGLLLIVSFFIPVLQRAGEEVTIWFNILASIAFVLGGANLFRLQLQNISDRNAGWGFSAVTLLCFLTTLLLGLFKVGSPPEASSEAYGTTAVHLPLSALPVFSIPIESPPTRGDGELLPKSVRQQLAISRTDGVENLTFTGWMSPLQSGDLLSFQDTLDWQCQTERLAELAVPPPALAGKVNYNAQHQQLLFTGPMSDDDRSELLKVLKPSEETTQAVSRLYDQSRRVTTKRVTDVPAGFAIPEQQQHIIRQTPNVTSGQTELTLVGPMSVGLRENLAGAWTNAPRVRPLLPQQQSELLAQIETQGAPLTEKQRTTFDNFFAADWKPELLIISLNSAGTESPTPKSYCELRAEIQAGNTSPDMTHPAPPPVELNAVQTELINNFVVTPEITFDQLLASLLAAGELTVAQQRAFGSFIAQLPTQAEHRKSLCFRLLSDGPLSEKQKDFLLEGARHHFRWRQQIGEMFIAAHQVKFPWSGFYSAPGSPFSWMFEYILQPLMTTTFAVLAFYVASAAFRAFRAKNLEAILLLGTAFIILLGRTSAGPALTSWIPDSFSAFRLDQMTVYIMSIFSTAGSRAIMIGIALGTISTSLKVILGIDRSYLGKGDE